MQIMCLYTKASEAKTNKIIQMHIYKQQQNKKKLLWIV